MLNRVAANHAHNAKLEIVDDVTATIHHLFRRFLPYQSFPGKTVKFLYDLCDRAGPLLGCPPGPRQRPFVCRP